MATTEITSTPDGTSPTHQIVCELGGINYVLTFRHMARSDGWHLDIDEYPSTRLVTGVRCRSGVNLLADAPGRGTLHVVPTRSQFGSVPFRGFVDREWRMWWDETWEGIP